MSRGAAAASHASHAQYRVSCIMGACIGRICEPFTARSHDRLTASFAEAALHPLETPPETPTGGLLQNGNKPSEEDEDDDDDGYESAKSDFSTCTWSSERSVEPPARGAPQRTPPPPRLATLASPQPTARGDGGDPKDHDGDACTPDAWRALSEATAHLEDDALDRLEDDTPGALEEDEEPTGRRGQASESRGRHAHAPSRGAPFTRRAVHST